MRTPIRWSFWQGVGPDAQKIIVPWLALTFYDMDDMGNNRNGDECVRVVGAYAFARYSANGINTATSRVREVENRDVYVDDLGHECACPCVGNACFTDCSATADCPMKRRAMLFCSNGNLDKNFDNPSNFETLTPEQKEVSVAVFLKDVHAVDVEYSLGVHEKTGDNRENAPQTSTGRGGLSPFFFLLCRNSIL